MRSDSVGFFWEDRPPEKKAAVEKIKRIPPDPVWLHPDYCPDVPDISFPLLTDHELAICFRNRDSMILDIECYPNYFLVVLTSYTMGKSVYEEYSATSKINYAKLKWIITNFELVTFNGTVYDMPMLSLAMSGMSYERLKVASDQIIKEKKRPYEIYREYRVKKLELNHIDLIEVAPLHAGLKMYGGRLHVHRMQDLPFAPETHLNERQIGVTRWYCSNDTVNTAFLFHALEEDIALRRALTSEYSIDLRSKSDAQIAEAVISKEVAKINGDRIKAPIIPEGTVYRFKAPLNVEFETPLLRDALRIIEGEQYIVGADGSIALPKAVKALKLPIADNVYRMGIGGLHSSETKLTLRTTDTFRLVDRDVTSYYPRIILNLSLFPKHLGRAFLHVYHTIVRKRLAAKVNKLKAIAATLKIVINGAFGKLINKYSDMYAPELGITVTLCGQLYLLMLIERLVLAGIRVVSANTDGIVLYVHTSQTELYLSIVKQWEEQTQFETEETPYDAIYIRDVNNYIAFKPGGEIKEKGAYANPWKSQNNQEILKKNPVNSICIEAIEQYLLRGIPIENTIMNSRDIRQFITVRGVDGGAVKSGTYLGKAIRWYYAQGEEGEIVYARNGNKVPRSEGAKPVMQLPEHFPTDINYEWYVQESYSLLNDFTSA